MNRTSNVFAPVASLVLILAGTCGSPAIAAVYAGPIVDPDNGHSYYLLTESSWQDAEAQAISLGGHLTTINDAAEQNWVFSMFGAYDGVYQSLWIGLSDAAQEGAFVWSDGESLSYTHWLPGQPDNNTGSENYVHMLRTGNGFGVTPGDWNDLDSPVSPYQNVFSPYAGVVEVVPEPSCWALAIGGVTSALLGLRRAFVRR